MKYDFGFLTFSILVITSSKGMRNAMEKKPKCQSIATKSVCGFLRKDGYNTTGFPNIYNHRNQEEALRDLNQFQPLMKIQCAKEISQFLCTTYLPFCLPPTQNIILPCRSLCLKSKSGCEEVMKRFGFHWPFNCTLFPDDTKGAICLVYNDNIVKTTPETVATTRHITSKKQGKKKLRGKVKGNENDKLKIKCPKGFRVDIRKVVHRNSKCCPHASKFVLSAICQTKTTCDFVVEQKTFGGHCEGKVGSVLVRYKCVIPSKNSSQC